jgi:PAS domain S-box-containing protein
MSVASLDDDKWMRLAAFSIDRAPDAILWIDAEGNCQRANEAACRMLGYSREELQSLKIHEFCPEHPPEGWQQHWGHLKSSKGRIFETRMRAKDGQDIPVEVSSNFLDFGGKEYTCAFVRNMTERKKAEEAISRLRDHNEMILAAAGEGIFGLDLQGNHTFVNPAAASILGFTREDLLGRHSHSMWHHTKRDGSPYPSAECPIYKAYKDGQVHFGDDEVFWRKDGTSFPAQYASTPIRNEAGELVGAVVTFLDITESKRIEERLREEEKMAAVARMLGDIGHDLKNLLTPIVMGGELLQGNLNGCESKLPNLDPDEAKATLQESRELIDLIRGSVRRVHDRVKEIADAVKGLSSPLRFVPSRIEVVAANVFEALRLYAREKGVSLRVKGLETLPAIQADENRLFNALYNLVNNAISEVPPGGSVEVRGTAESEAKSVVLSISDTGRGMSREVRESLFTNRAISGKVGGTGLGTKIVKDVVDAHGGSITVESKEGAGTTFRIRLPIAGPGQST